MYPKLIVVASITIITFAACSATKTHYCPPNNEPVIVPRNPDKQYASYVKKTDFSLKGTLEVLDKIKLADIDAGTKGTVTKLRTDLDQFSSRYQDVLKGSFSAFAYRPCDKDVQKRHFDLLEQMAKENTELEKMRIELNKLASAGHFAGADAAKIKEIINAYETATTRNAISK
ncbi:MAG TPA: hypothetical protein VMR70_10640 [Flavisolibacter sp.]|nr:hypothetical protein [Flavisolibacter sp.]